MEPLKPPTPEEPSKGRPRSFRLRNERNQALFVASFAAGGAIIGLFVSMANGRGVNIVFAVLGAIIATVLATLFSGAVLALTGGGARRDKP